MPITKPKTSVARSAAIKSSLKPTTTKAAAKSIDVKVVTKKKFVFLDDSGKLFGKFDLFIPLFALVILTLVVMIMRVLLQKETYVTVELFASGGEWWWNNPSPPYWLADPIKKGTIEYDPQGNVLVEVLEARKFEEANRKNLWVKVKLRVTPDKKSSQFRFRRENLQVGSVIYIAPNNVKVVCNVLRIEGMEDDRQDVTKLVTVENFGVSPWYADNVKIGDVMRDSDGRVLAEILHKEVSTAGMTTTDYLGNTHARRDPLKRDVVMKIRLKLTRSDGIDYFSYFIPIKKNFFITIPFETMNIEGNITNFYDEPIAPAN